LYRRNSGKGKNGEINDGKFSVHITIFLIELSVFISILYLLHFESPKRSLGKNQSSKISKKYVKLCQKSLIIYTST